MYNIMPIDKQSKASTTKPITPALSSRFRNAKAPVAPKLAGSAPASPAISARKESREQTLSPPSERSQASSLNNVTPRSGARITRIGTESPSSPAAGRLQSGNPSISGTLASFRQSQTTSSPNQHTPIHLRTTAKPSSPNTSAVRRVSGASNVSKKDEESTKFFRANDAKPVPNYQSPKSVLSPRPYASAFLNNGSPRTTSSAPPSAIHSTGPRREDTFIRATEANVRATRTTTVVRKQSITSMTSMTSTKPRSPELLRTQSYPQPRPQTTPQMPPAKASSVTPPKPTSPRKPIPPSQSSPSLISPSSPFNRRPSFGSNISGFQLTRPMLHKKSASVSSFRPSSPKLNNLPLVTHGIATEKLWIPSTVTIPLQHNIISTASPDTLSPRSASLASSKTVGTSVTSDTDLSEVSKTGSAYTNTTQSDSHFSQSQLPQSQLTPLAQAQMNAANARRERKVLDLEISNSSLLAINKTLEKELRKQSAELRRFRRLSRSGRLSFAPSNRSVSGQSVLSLDTLQEQTEDEDTYSDEEDEESEIDDFSESNDPLEDSLMGATAASRRRARDERRLMLDLSKHQELLVDSQKLTQSIRKCLNMSESLIKEGNQALKYKVGIGDVKLGGKVLSTEDSDNEDDTELDNTHPEPDTPRQGLLSPSTSNMEIQEPRLWVRSIQSTMDGSFEDDPSDVLDLR